MKTLALATAISMILLLPAFAQDSKQSTGIRKQGTEAAATGVDATKLQSQIDLFTAALQKEPNNESFLAGRAQNYLKLRKFEEAIRDLNKLIANNPKRQAFYEARANGYLGQKSYRKALGDFSEALRVGPPTSALFLKQAQTATLSQDYSLGSKAAKASLALKPDEAEALAVLGSCEQKLGLFQDSLTHLSKAVDLGAGDAQLLLIRADTLRSLGKKDLAQKDVERAHQMGDRR